DAKFCYQCGFLLPTVVSPTPTAVEIFLSYSHEDEEILNKLIKHLSPLRRNGRVKLWYDRDIDPGAEWASSINHHLLTADIILLLISPSFLASDYCYTIEMEEAMKRHARNEACVIPVIVRSSDWHDAPFGRLQALPTNGKPVRNWNSQDEALLE